VTSSHRLGARKILANVAVALIRLACGVTYPRRAFTAFQGEPYMLAEAAGNKKPRRMPCSGYVLTEKAVFRNETDEVGGLYRRK
jgi:hypothetical protein